MPELPWIIAIVCVALLAIGAALAWARSTRHRRPPPLPTNWALAARPVFTADERRVFHLLREALPHHIVLSKLPLVRFSQPEAPGDVRYWYDLLGSLHVGFAVCSPNGRVLAAIDLETERGTSRRVLQIKQSVLGACRVRYLRCPADRLPSIAELQLLVPPSGNAPRAPQPPAPAAAAFTAPHLAVARDTLSHTLANRRAERQALWHDSTPFQDSFFAPDSRQDASGHSGFGALATPGARRSGQLPPLDDELEALAGDIAGVVVDGVPQPGPASRH